ncbi:MAG: ferrous iron transport protein B [Deltaproteobacteria bacterium]|nr:ferrous iron transport protein B [Deltaproteobacteria bacterium]
MSDTSEEKHPPGSAKIPLSYLKEGDSAIVFAIAGGRSLISRLAAMGIAPNTAIKVMRVSGGLHIIQAVDTRVALGRGETDKIIVSPGTPVDASDISRQKRITVALAGQPNVGKSTIFNILTGLSQHVGNWPGKTVEKKEGTHRSDDWEMHIVDLPGTYGLTAFSEEERIARDFIIGNRPDIIVLLVNAAAPERSLYLLSELLLLDVPILCAVNMIDVAEAQGIRIDIKALRKALGIPVVAMVASKNIGIHDLVKEIVDFADGHVDYQPQRPEVAPDHREIFDTLKQLTQPYIEPPNTVLWSVTKLMEGDPENAGMLESIIPAPVWRDIQALLLQHEDSLHAVVHGRYDWIEDVTRATVSRFRRGQILTTDRIDHILTRPLFGIPILIAIFGLVFLMTYEIGFPLQKVLEGAVQAFADSLAPVLTPAPVWLKGLFTDGVIGGVGSVLTFLPILILFFGVMALLENVGYMARAAFVMDRFMHLIGLHGKSFIPLCLGFGCNVPAVLGARIVESRKERLLTVFLAPFVPCTARIAVLTFVSAAMFGERAFFVSTGLMAANILLLGLVGMAANRVLMKDEPMPFIMELPLYHPPDARTISMTVWIRTFAFVKKAGTIILAVSILVWLLSYFPAGQVESSILARVGRILEPLGFPLGLDWKMLTALVTSIAAKENAVATMAVLYGVGDQGLISALPQTISPASALSFLVVLMFFIPCAATMVVMKQEMADRKWFFVSMSVMLAVSLTGGIIAYQAARWFGLG